MYMSGLPNAASASVDPVFQSFTSRLRSWMIFLPRPPPPAAALRITGRPIRSACSSSWFSELIVPEPGRIGTPAFCIASRARILSPIRRIASGGGPIQVSPQRAVTSANSASSARKP